MTDRSETLPVVESIFRGERRSWKGLGGGGNPKETWDDLRAMLMFTFLLDRDSVYGISAWLSTRLSKQLDDLAAQCSAIEDATSYLAFGRDATGVENLGELDKAQSLLAKAVSQMRIGSSSSAALVERGLASDALRRFASESLVPALSSGSTTSPSEARKTIREQWSSLQETYPKVKDLLDRLSSMPGSYEFTAPHPTCVNLLSRIRSKLTSLYLRLLRLDPKDRASSARVDLVSLASYQSMMDLLGSTPTPPDVRGVFALSATGTGTGASRLSSRSAPYLLEVGLSDQLRVAVDGAAAVTYTLPSVAAGIAFSSRPIPRASPMVLANLNWFRLSSDGRSGAVIVVPSGVQFTLPFAAVMGLNVPLSPTLAPLMGVTTSVVLGLYDQILFTFNPVNSPPVGVGSYIELQGSVELMGALGFDGSDMDDPTRKTVRVFHPVVEQTTVVESIERLIPGVSAAPENTILFTGDVEIDPSTPDRYLASSYWGTALWDPDTSVALLSGGDIRQVRVGMVVSLDSFSAYGLVSEVRSDGVVVSSVVGSLAAGSYTVSVVSLTDFPTGAITHFNEMGKAADYRILSAIYNADGRILVTLTHRTHVGTYPAGAITLKATVLQDKIRVSSDDRTRNGSLQFVAVANTAATELGILPGTSSSTVWHVDTSPPVEGTGVQSGDQVTLGASTYVVDEVLSPNRLKLDVQVPGSTWLSPATIRNMRAVRLENLNTLLPAWGTVPSVSSIWSEVKEVLRVEGAVGAGSRLRALCYQLRLVAESLSLACKSYRLGYGEINPFLVSLRDAMEEAGADRAVDLLLDGKLADLFVAGTDDASYSRTLLRGMRHFSSKVLGGSVFTPVVEEEQAVMHVGEGISLDMEPLAADKMGPPGMTKR